METNELLARVHEGNEEAFRLLFALHGETLYQSLITRCHDKRIAREVLKDVFQKARATLRNSSQPDGTALWLNELAKNGLNDRLAVNTEPADASAQSQSEQREDIPKVNKQEPEEAERIICEVRSGMQATSARKEHHVPTTVLAIILIVLLLLSIWYIIGTLMKMGKLPQADLGYSWFSNTIFPLF